MELEVRDHILSVACDDASLPDMTSGNFDAFRKSPGGRLVTGFVRFLGSAQDFLTEFGGLSAVIARSDIVSKAGIGPQIPSSPYDWFRQSRTKKYRSEVCHGDKPRFWVTSTGCLSTDNTP